MTITPTDQVADPALRPAWRGVIHRVGTLVFVPAAALLVALAERAADRTALVVYAVGVTAMLGVSAVYHSGRFGPVALGRLKRLDHSTILLAIAGSYTAVAVLALPTPSARRLLTFVWVAAVIGMGVRMIWLRAPYPVVAIVYVTVGWGALLEVSALVDALSATQFVLLVGGGVLYTIGAGVYAAHRPNPWPAVFGYHELFHALVMGGVTSHYLLVLTLVLESR